MSVRRARSAVSCSSPTRLDSERLAAEYADGVLTVRIPVKEQAKPRRVSVSAGRQQRKPIDAKSSDGERETVNAATS